MKLEMIKIHQALMQDEYQKLDSFIKPEPANIEELRTTRRRKLRKKHERFKRLLKKMTDESAMKAAINAMVKKADIEETAGLIHNDYIEDGDPVSEFGFERP